MHGFESKSHTTDAAAAGRVSAPQISDLSPAEIDVLIARAKVERAAHFAAWLKQTFRLWASLVPGRRSIRPEGFSRWQTFQN